MEDTEVKAAQPDTQVLEGTPQETLEAIRAERDALRIERDSLNKVVSKGESRKKAEAALLDRYSKTVDAKIEYLASLWDKEHGTEPEPENLSALKGLQRFKVEAPPEADEIPSDIRVLGEVARDVCADNKWGMDSPQYKKAVELGPSDGLRYLYKEAARVAAEQVELKHKSAIKESGGTGAAGGPSASSSRSYTREQIANMSYTEYKANEKDIDAAAREGRIT